MHRPALIAITVLAAVLAGCKPPPPAPKATPTRRPSTPTASPSPSPTPTGRKLANITPPTARAGAAMAYDPVSGKLILFGGDADASTWAWDTQRWTKLHPVHHPPALRSPGLVLDPTSGHLLLVGGVGTLNGDFPAQEQMWRWDGSDWSSAGDNPYQGPVNAAADPFHHEVLMDGPFEGGPGAPSPPPTAAGGGFVWNGTVWNPAPATLSGTLADMGTEGAAIAYDGITHRVIEFGGSQQGFFGDTIAWDGQRWQTLLSQPAPSSTQPPGGSAAAATDDSYYGRIILLAGGIENARLATTWEWDGASWQRLRGTEPPPLTGEAIAYDPDAGGVVIFGGNDMSNGSAVPTDAMWVWRGAGWEPIQQSAPQ